MDRRAMGRSSDASRRHLREEVRGLVLEGLRRGLAAPNRSRSLPRVQAPPPKELETRLSGHMETVERYLAAQGLRKTLATLRAETSDSGLNLTSSDAREQHRHADAASDCPSKASPAKAPSGRPIAQVAEDVWARLERKYRRKLREAEERRGREQRRRLAEMERRYKAALLRKEEELREAWDARLAEEERKGLDSEAQLHQDRLSLAQKEGQHKSHLLAQVRQLDARRQQLQQLEDEFAAHQDAQRTALQRERDELSQKKADLLRQETRLQEKLEAAKAETLAIHRTEHAHLVARAKEEARRFEREAQLAQDRLSELLGVEKVAEARSRRIGELETKLVRFEAETEQKEEQLEELRSKLRSQGDYDRLKASLVKLRASGESGKGREAEAELLGLEAQLKVARVELAHERSLRGQAESREAEAKAERRAVQERLDRALAQTQAQAADAVVQAQRLAQLRVQQEGRRRPAVPLSSPPSSSADEVTPPVLRHARLRLADLERESLVLDTSLQAYQRKTTREMEPPRRREETRRTEEPRREAPRHSVPRRQPPSRQDDPPPAAPSAHLPASGPSILSAPKTSLHKAPDNSVQRDHQTRKTEPARQSVEAPSEPRARAKPDPPKKTAAEKPPEPKAAPKPAPQPSKTTAEEEEEFEAELRRRSREKRAREEALRKAVEEESRARTDPGPLETSKTLKSPKKEAEKKGEFVVAEPDIDPEMAKYMALLAAQRSQREEKPKEKSRRARMVETEVEDPKISPTGAQLSPDDDAW